MALSFATLKSNYPTTSKEELYRSMGGEWPQLIHNALYNNTCAVRLSLALNKSGMPIDRNMREAITGAGESIIVKVATMGRFLRSKLGDVTWGISKNPSATFDPTHMPQFSGIVVYHADWDDATGHFDLWSGSRFIGAGSFTGIYEGFDVALWRIN